MWPDLVIAEQCEHLIGIARARRFWIKDHGLSNQVRQPQWRSLREQRMIEWQSDDKALIAQELPSNGRIIKRDAAEAHINPPLLQRSNLLQAGELSQHNLNVGSNGAKAADDLSLSLAILPVGGGVISLGWRSRFDP